MNAWFRLAVGSLLIGIGVALNLSAAHDLAKPCEDCEDEDSFSLDEEIRSFVDEAKVIDDDA